MCSLRGELHRCVKAYSTYFCPFLTSWKGLQARWLRFSSGSWGQLCLHLCFFTGIDIIDSGEVWAHPGPSFPALLYFFCVLLSHFLFLSSPSLSFPQLPADSWITVYQCRARKRLPDRIMFCLILGSCAVMRANSLWQWEQEEAKARCDERRKWRLQSRTHLWPSA